MEHAHFAPQFDMPRFSPQKKVVVAAAPELIPNSFGPLRCASLCVNFGLKKHHATVESRTSKMTPFNTSMIV